MPITEDEIEITEIAEFNPSRVDGVKSAANGFPILMLKSVDGETVETEATLEDVLAELDKADGEKRPPCPLCKGSKKIKNGGLTCPKCKGSGYAPMVGDTEKTLAEIAEKESGVAASGAEAEPLGECPTCKGVGHLPVGKAKGSECPDCQGTGKDARMPPDSETNIVDGDPGKVTVGAGGRETIDKSIDFYENDSEDGDLEKAKLKAKARNALPDSAFALPGRRYPIHDASHARNALARVAQHGTPEEKAKVRAAVRRKYPDIDVGGDDAEKADGAILSGLNPSLAATADDIGADAPDEASAPGSPAWEAVDAATATAAALALMEASELIRTFAQREQIEVAAGEGNDVFDSFVATEALCGVTRAIGVMATLAFHEGLEAAKSLDENDIVIKAGKRLSTRSVSALAAARDHLNELLGKDDPAVSTKDDEDKKMDPSAKFIAAANKSIDQEVITVELTTEEFDSRVASAVVKALTEVNEAALEKAKPAVDEAASIAEAKAANNKSKKKNPKDDDTDLEDEAEQGTHETANNSPSPKGAKALETEENEDVEDVAAKEVDDAEDIEPTEEEVAAEDQLKQAKKMLKEAKRAREEAARDAAAARAIKEGIEEATKAYGELQERIGNVEELRTRLAGVEKQVAPSPIQRMAPAAAQVMSPERDILDKEIAKLERVANTATDRDIVKGARGQLRDLYARRQTV